MTFALTKKQDEALSVCAGNAAHVMLFGGSRSGKTFLIVRNIVARALKASNSRHAIFRFRLNHLRSSIFLDTFPKVMALAFAGVEYKKNEKDMVVTLCNGSEIWFAGLDDKDRTEKILGMEFVTIYFGEVSQIPYSSVLIALTRLAQQIKQDVCDGALLKLRAFYDCNPPPKNHWTYRVFVEHRDPDSRKPLSNPADYVSFQMNPRDNEANLSPEYIKQLENMPARMRKRFLDGQFADATPNALFTEDTINIWRVEDGKVPDFVRVIVAVDPSGSGDTLNTDNDAIGIVVMGLGVDGNAYLLEDCTVKAGPATWGKVATSAFERHQADCIVAEVNFGGAMVQQTISVARPRTPFKAVTASRSKMARAEPFSALYEQGKVRHVGDFQELEDELCAFSTHGYTGSDSPNRADALIWALAELFPAITNHSVKSKTPQVKNIAMSNHW